MIRLFAHVNSVQSQNHPNFKKKNVGMYISANNRYVETLHFLCFNATGESFLIWCCGNAVLMVWLC